MESKSGHGKQEKKAIKGYKRERERERIWGWNTRLKKKLIGAKMVGRIKK